MMWKKERGMNNKDLCKTNDSAFRLCSASLRTPQSAKIIFAQCLRKSHPSDITREQFEAIQSILNRATKSTPPRKYDLYDIFCTFFYLWAGCFIIKLDTDVTKIGLDKALKLWYKNTSFQIFERT